MKRERKKRKSEREKSKKFIEKWEKRGRQRERE